MSSKEELEAAAIKWQGPEQSERVVLLLGWAGCRDRYLAKYALMYEELGIRSVRTTAPITKIRSFASYKEYARLLLKEVFEREDVLKHTYTCHSFSMNGCSLFTAMWDLLEGLPNGKDIKHRVDAAVFDSAPADTTPRQSARAISMASLPPSTYHPAMTETLRLVLLSYFYVHEGVMWVQSYWQPDVYEKQRAYHRMLNMQLPKRQLYIYSEGDDICSADSIEAFLEKEKNKNVECVPYKIPSSPHVQHYRTEPHSYKKNVAAFLQVNVPALAVSAQA